MGQLETEVNRQNTFLREIVKAPPGRKLNQGREAWACACVAVARESKVLQAAGILLLQRPERCAIGTGRREQSILSIRRGCLHAHSSPGYSVGDDCIWRKPAR